MKGSPLLQKAIPYSRRKSIPMKGSPLLLDIEKSRDSPQHPYYRRKSLTIEGNPLQQKEVHSRDCRRKSLTIDGKPLLLFYIEKSRDSPGTVPGQSRHSPQYPYDRRKERNEHPYYRRKSLSIERNPLLQKDKSLLQTEIPCYRRNSRTI